MTDDAIELSDSEATAALEALQRECQLFVISQSCWLGEYTILDSKVLVEGEDVDDELVGKPRWQLIPANWRRRLNSFGPRARRIIRNKYAIKLDLASYYLVPECRSDECLEAVEAVNIELRTAVREFVEEYPKIVEDIRTKLGTQFALVEKYLPEASKLPARYSISVIPLRVSLVELETNQMSPIQRRAKSMANQKVAEMVAATIAQPRNRLIAVISNLRGIISREKTIRESSLDVVRNSLELVKSFSFAADQQLLQTINELDKQLNKLTAEDIRKNASAADSLLNALGGVEMAARNDASGSTALKKFKRTVCLV